MKKFLSILSIFLVALIAIGAAGCIDDDDGGDDDINGSAVIDFDFDESIVTVDPTPEGFTLLAVQPVTASEEVLGVTNGAQGLAGYYSYGGSNVYLSGYLCADTSAALGCINQTKQEAERLQGDVSTVTINDHNATLVKLTTTAGNEKFILVWNVDNLLVVVDAPENQSYDAVKTLAEASGL